MAVSLSSICQACGLDAPSWFMTQAQGKLGTGEAPRPHRPSDVVGIGGIRV